MLSLKNISNENLVSKLELLRKTENLTLADIILYLSEIDERKLYRDLGYSSLFTYLKEGLGYSEGASYRRMQAAKCIKTNPEIYEGIKNGKLSLCAVAEISRIKETPKKLEVIKEAEGKSKEEVKLITSKYLPIEPSKKDTIKPKIVEVKPDLFSENQKPIESRYTFTVEVNEEFMSLYKEAKAFIGHVTASEVFMRSLKEFVTKRKEVKAKRSLTSDNNRLIPKSTKVEVRKRDNNQCTFISFDGKRCTERHALEFDHMLPFLKAGAEK